MGYLFLCRFDLDKRDKRGDPLFIECLGTMLELRDGFFFVPWGINRNPGTWTKRTQEEATPGWAKDKKQGFTRFLTRSALRKAQASAYETQR